MFREGDTIFDRYELLRRLGQGGQGAVFEAADTRTGERVALKCARLAGDAGDITRRQFEREGELLRSLDHPGLPKVFDLSVDHDLCALAMEYIEGEDLAAARARRGRPFDLREAVAWADRLLEILEYLHGQSPPVLHRDIKPANIKVLPGGRVVLLDFGLARVTRTGHGVTTNSVVGYTETFAPFEQTQGEPVGPDGDLYSLGATVYWMLAPEPAPNAASRVFALAVGRPDPIRGLEDVAPGVPGFVAGAVHRALAISPDERFHAAREMRDALAGVAVEEPDETTRVRRRRVTVAVPAAPSEMLETLEPSETRPAAEPRSRRRVPWWTAAIVALLAAGAGLGLVVYFGGLGTDQLAPPAVEPPPPEPQPPATVPAPESFSVEMTGEVRSRKGIRMRLSRSGRAVAGSFVWVDRAGVGDFAERLVEGTVESDGSATLTEYEGGWGAPRRATGSFVGSLTADPETGALAFAGIWSPPAGDQATTFSLRERVLGLPAGARLVARRSERQGRKPAYRVEASYPELEGSPAAAAFAEAVEGVVASRVEEWIGDVEDDERDEESRLRVRYEVTHGGQDLVSVRFYSESYLGADDGLFFDEEASRENAFDGVTFDLRAGREVSLDELFRPGAPYRERLAAIVREALRGRGLETWDEELAVEPFEAWNLVPGGILLSFPPDRIAPASAGVVTVLVEHERVADLYREGSPAARVRSAPDRTAAGRPGSSL